MADECVKVCKSADRGRSIWSLRTAPILLFTLDWTLLKCSPKVSFFSSWNLKYFLGTCLRRGMLLKIKERYYWPLPEKVSLWAWLEISG